MGMGQTLLVLAALAILASVTISSNRLVLNQVDVVQGSEALITGTGIGQEMVEQVTEKYFDGNVIPPKTTDTVSILSAPLTFGPEAGEIATDPTTFHDIDDYDGYMDSVYTSRLGYFYRTDRVCYVSENPPYADTTAQTFLKKVYVTIKNPYLGTPGDSIQISKVVSYRY